MKRMVVVALMAATLSSCNTDFARLRLRNDTDSDVKVIHCENASCSKVFDTSVISAGGEGSVNASLDVPQDLSFERLADNTQYGCVSAAPMPHGKARVRHTPVDQPVLLSVLIAAARPCT